MPLVLRKELPEAVLMLWDIAEDEGSLGGLVSLSDRESASRFGSADRRLEHLACRAALRSEGVSGDVSYDHVGAPCVKGEGVFVSMSHTEGLAAVIISKSGRCAVDVECLSRDLRRVVPRYLSPTERQKGTGIEYFEMAAWCAKEAAYKLSGRRELDLIRDIKIVDAEVSSVKIELACARVIDVRYMFYDDYMVAYCCEYPATKQEDAG